ARLRPPPGRRRGCATRGPPTARCTVRVPVWACGRFAEHNSRRGGRATARGPGFCNRRSSALVAETSPWDRDFPPFRQGEQGRRRESRLGPLPPPTRLAPSMEVPPGIGPRVCPAVFLRVGGRGGEWAQ